MKQQRSVAVQVMKQIQSGKVYMKPRRYYALLTLTSVVAVMTTGVVSAYLSSLLFYWVRIQTANTPAWGARARLSEASAAFPWWALGLAVALTGFAIWLVRRHGRMYRYRTLSVALAIVTVSLLLGSALSYVNIGRPHVPVRHIPHRAQTPGDR